jgi:hypothetical protein
MYNDLTQEFPLVSELPSFRPMPLDLRLDDVLRLRKPHPCGGYEWRVVRLGADIGLECLTCERRVMLTRREVEKRTKTIVSRGLASQS